MNELEQQGYYMAKGTIKINLQDAIEFIDIRITFDQPVEEVFEMTEERVTPQELKEQYEDTFIRDKSLNEVYYVAKIFEENGKCYIGYHKVDGGLSDLKTSYFTIDAQGKIPAMNVSMPQEEQAVLRTIYL